MSQLRFKIDENLPAEVVAVFAAAGHSVDTVADEGLGGAPDAKVAEAAAAEQRIVVTLDRNFANPRSIGHSPLPGAIVFRLRIMESEA